MSTPDKQGLQPSGYPSAFDSFSDEAPAASAFGAPATLPGVLTPDSAQVPAVAFVQQSEEETTESTAFSMDSAENHSGSLPALQGTTAAQGRSRSMYTSAFPAITPEQIADPVLRAKFSGASARSSSSAETSQNAFGTASLDSATTSLQPTVYPSASPQTASIPLPEYKPKQAGNRSRLGQSLRSFVSSQQNLTQPLRGVASVAQRQFTLSAQKRHEQYVQEKEQAREVLNFTVRLAETMFHFGADARDVDSAIVAICASYGLEDVEVNVTNQSVIVNYVSDPDYTDTKVISLEGSESRERFSHTVVRVVRTRSDNYSSLTAIYGLIHSITEKGLSRTQAERRLKEINRSKKLYSPLGIHCAELLMIGAFTFGVGGSWRAALVAVIVAVVALTGMHFASKMSLPEFFMMAIGSGIITTGALWVGSEGSLAQNMGFYVSSPHVVAAGLLLLLPTSMMVSAAQDALTGYPLTAAGKFVATGLDFLGLVVGIAMALTVMSYFDAATLDVQQAVFNPPPVWLSIAGMVLGSVAAAATAQGTVTNMLWIVAVSGAGQLVYYGTGALIQPAPTTFTTAFAAFVVGALSAYIAYKSHAPQISFYVPGFLFLLPGLSIFRGLYSVVIDPSPIAGMSNLVGAFSTIIAMASGVVLGSYMVHYLLDKVVRATKEVAPN